MMSQHSFPRVSRLDQKRITEKKKLLLHRLLLPPPLRPRPQPRLRMISNWTSANFSAMSKLRTFPAFCLLALRRIRMRTMSSFQPGLEAWRRLTCPTPIPERDQGHHLQSSRSSNPLLIGMVEFHASILVVDASRPCCILWALITFKRDLYPEWGLH